MEYKAAFKNNIIEESKTDIDYTIGCQFYKLQF